MNRLCFLFDAAAIIPCAIREDDNGTSSGVDCELSTLSLCVTRLIRASLLAADSSHGVASDAGESSFGRTPRSTENSFKRHGRQLPMFTARIFDSHSGQSSSDLLARLRYQDDWHASRAAFWQLPMRHFTAEAFQELIAELKHVRQFKILSSSIHASLSSPSSVNGIGNATNTNHTKAYRRGIVSRSLLQLMSPTLWYSTGSDGGSSAGSSGRRGLCITEGKVGGNLKLGARIDISENKQSEESRGGIFLLSQAPSDMTLISSLILTKGATSQELKEDTRRTFVKHFEDLKLNFFWIDVDTPSSSAGDTKTQPVAAADDEPDQQSSQQNLLDARSCLECIAEMLLGRVIDGCILTDASRMVGLESLAHLIFGADTSPSRHLLTNPGKSTETNRSLVTDKALFCGALRIVHSNARSERESRQSTDILVNIIPQASSDDAPVPQSFFIPHCSSTMIFQTTKEQRLRLCKLPDDHSSRMQMWNRHSLQPRPLSKCPMRKNAAQWLLRNPSFTDQLSDEGLLRRGCLNLRALMPKSVAIDILRKEEVFSHGHALRFVCRPCSRPLEAPTKLQAGKSGASVHVSKFSALMEILSATRCVGIVELDNGLGSDCRGALLIPVTTSCAIMEVFSSTCEDLVTSSRTAHKPVLGEVSAPSDNGSYRGGSILKSIEKRLCEPFEDTVNRSGVAGRDFAGEAAVHLDYHTPLSLGQLFDVEASRRDDKNGEHRAEKDLDVLKSCRSRLDEEFEAFLSAELSEDCTKDVRQNSKVGVEDFEEVAVRSSLWKNSVFGRPRDRKDQPNSTSETASHKLTKVQKESIANEARSRYKSVVEATSYSSSAPSTFISGILAGMLHSYYDIQSNKCRERGRLINHGDQNLKRARLLVKKHLLKSYSDLRREEGLARFANEKSVPCPDNLLLEYQLQVLLRMEVAMLTPTKDELRLSRDPCQDAKLHDIVQLLQRISFMMDAKEGYTLSCFLRETCVSLYKTALPYSLITIYEVLMVEPPVTLTSIIARKKKKTAIENKRKDAAVWQEKEKSPEGMGVIAEARSFQSNQGGLTMSSTPFNELGNDDEDPLIRKREPSQDEYLSTSMSQRKIRKTNR